MTFTDETLTLLNAARMRAAITGASMTTERITRITVGKGLLTCLKTTFRQHEAIVQPADMGPMGGGYEAFVNKRMLGFHGGGSREGQQMRARLACERELRRLTGQPQPATEET